MFKIKEGKTGLEFNKTDKEGNVLTVDRTQKWNKLRAKTDLKEMYIVRYADDFKLFCRDYATARKVMCATKLWLAENMHLRSDDRAKGQIGLHTCACDSAPGTLRTVPYIDSSRVQRLTPRKPITRFMSMQKTASRPLYARYKFKSK